MCEFFSFCTDPEGHGGKRFYFNWEQRTTLDLGDCDTHSGICKHYGLDEDKCNKYEFNPLTKKFTIDQINSPVDDSAQAHDWVDGLDFKKVVEPLIIKPIVNPFEIDPPEIGEEQLALLKKWASVWNSVRDSVRDSVWASVRASVAAYSSSFFGIKYDHDFSPAITLWEQGLVPSLDGKTWRLHSKNGIAWEGEL